MSHLDKQFLENARRILRNPESYTETDVKYANTYLAAWSEGKASETFTGFLLPDKPHKHEVEGQA